VHNSELRAARLRSLFDSQANRWEEVLIEYDYQMPKIVLNTLTLLSISPSSHLDLGCANGHLGFVMDRSGFRCDRQGVDISSEMVRVAGETGSYSLTVEANLEDGIPEELNSSFDLITALGMFEFLEDPRAALSGARDLILPHGHALLTFKCSKPELGQSGSMSSPNLNNGKPIQTWHHSKTEVNEILHATRWNLRSIDKFDAYCRETPVEYWFVVATPTK